MKTNKIYSKVKTGIILSLLVFAGLSCSDETTINPGGNPEKPVVPEGMTALKVSFIIPGKAQSYADISLAGTALENKIDSISLFLFDNNRGDTLINVYTVPNPAIGTDTVVLVTEKSDKVKLIAVANPADSLVTNDWLPYINVLDLDKFEKLTTLHSDSMPKPSFIMTAYNKGTVVDLSGNTPAFAEFELTRLVARIDILNRDSVGLLHTFELQKARMVNIPSQAYLLPNPIDRLAAPASAYKLSDLDWVELDHSDGSAGKMESQLYMYPAGNGTDDSGVALEIEGLYNGSETKYSIPFKNKEILPNHRYVVALDSINPVTVFATVTVVDWETDTIKFDPNYGGVPTVTYTLSGGLTTVTGTTGIDTIKFNGYQSATITFEVESPIVEPVFSTEADWISITKEETEKSYADVVFVKKYEISFEENQDIAREALIHFVNPARPTERVTYCVMQTISNNPLAKFAKANLMIDHTIGEDLTARNAGLTTNFGAWFQWGRKAAFVNPSQGTPTAPVAYDVARMTETAGDFYGGTGQSVWHNTTGHENDLWTSLVNQASGVVDNDPCPVGYRLPNADEFLAIIPYNKNAGDYTNNHADKTNKTSTTTEMSGNQILLSTGPSVYYPSDGIEKTLYGIKKLGTADAYALRWSYKGTGVHFVDQMQTTGGDAYLEIACIKAIANAYDNVEAIKALNWKKAAIRLFPTGGCRYSYDGTPHDRNHYGIYWSSSASTLNNGWYMEFNSSAIYPKSVARTFGFSVRCVLQ